MLTLSGIVKYKDTFRERVSFSLGAKSYNLGAKSYNHYFHTFFMPSSEMMEFIEIKPPLLQMAVL